MILYIIVLIIIIYLIYKYKTKHSYWITQPVFHKYNLLNWLYSPRIINKHPIKDQWYDSQNIKTYNINEITESFKYDFIFLIYFNYKNSSSITYKPTYNEIMPYFTGHNKKSYISVYYEDELLTHLKTDKIIKNKKIIGVITSRPLNLKLNDMETIIAYTDYLCIDKNYRNKKISPKLISTHYYDFNKETFQYPIALFKRESILNDNIIPLINTKVYGFNLKLLKYNITCNFKLIQINSINIHLIYKILKSNFKCMIICDFSNLLELINTNNIIVYVLVDIQNIQDILCVYFFRNIATQYDTNLAIEFFASINYIESENLFFDGFLRLLESLKNYNILLIEDISHNNIIIKNLFINNNNILEYNMAYYAYNLIHNPINSDDAIIIA